MTDEQVTVFADDARVESLAACNDRMDELAASLAGFGHNTKALASIWDIDHGPRDGLPLRPWIDTCLAESGIDFLVVDWTNHLWDKKHWDERPDGTNEIHIRKA